MVKLDTFRIVGVQFAFILAWVYVAAFVARIAGAFWPEIRVAAFLVIATFFVTGGLAAMVQQMRGGKESTFTAALSGFGPLVVGIAMVLLVGDIISHALTEHLAKPVRIWGIMFWLAAYATFVRDKFHGEKLEADLRRKNPEDENQRI